MPAIAERYQHVLAILAASVLPRTSDKRVRGGWVSTKYVNPVTEIDLSVKVEDLTPDLSIRPSNQDRVLNARLPVGARGIVGAQGNVFADIRPILSGTMYDNREYVPVIVKGEEEQPLTIRRAFQVRAQIRAAQASARHALREMR